MEARKMFGIFRESGPPEVREHLFTMEIFHGGYFDKQLDGTKKYNIPRFNKTGGKIYLDGLDPEKISWVEMNNIAYELGYRELPISYHFKVPGSLANVGWIEIKSDGDAIEMVKMIPLKKKQISVYITGGGRRKYAEALADFQKDVAPDFENPLNKVSALEKQRAHFEANLFASQLYSGVEGMGARFKNVDEMEGRRARFENADVIDAVPLNEVIGVIDIDDDDVEIAGPNEGVPSQGTFVGLDDIVTDLDIGGKRKQSGEHNGTEPKKKGKRFKHSTKRPWPPGYKDQLSGELEEIRQKEIEAAEKKEREELERLQREEAAIRESQASGGLNFEEAEIREREEAKQAAREEAEKREADAAEKRATKAFKVRQELANELEARLKEKKKGKGVAGGSKAKKSGRKPKDPRYNTRNKGKKRFEAVQNEGDDDTDSTDGFEFYVDSDYDLEHDEVDDVEFQENVEEPSHVPEYEEMGYDGYCSDEHVESDGLESLHGSETEEDEDGNHIKKETLMFGGRKVIPWIRSVDMVNPQFRLCLAFPNVEQSKEALREYAIRNQVGLWFERNSPKKVEVKCQWGCHFRVYASRVQGWGDTLLVKTLNNKHTYSLVETSHFLTYRRIAAEIKDTLLADEDWSRKGIHNHINKKYNLDVGVQTITRAKRLAIRMNEGHYVNQYNKLAAYRRELLRSNPRSTIEIKTHMDGPIRRFHRMYICFKACKDGWMAGCRLFICLDGCHIKWQHPGQLLTAVGIDANNGMYPIAYAVVEIESEETWQWVLEYLKEDLRMENNSSYVFMSDKQKGLENVIKALFQNAQHRHCVRHLYNNFKYKNPGEGLKQLMCNAARSNTKPWHNKHMEDLRMLKQDAFTWFEKRPPIHWSRAFFEDNSKCDILLNNFSESFNSAILPARDKPILTMLEKIRMDMMIRNSNRRVACEKWKDLVGPRIKKILDKTGQRASLYRAYRGNEFIFQVTRSGENDSKHAVDLGLHTCTYRRWQLSGIPCVHAICAIRFKKQDACLYCDDYLMPSSYMRTYTPTIFPIAGEDDWEEVDYPIAPPPYKNQTGRPKLKRNKEAGEKNRTTAPPAPIEGKLGRKGIKMTCKICGQLGHNKLGCLITKAKKAAVTGGSNTKKRVRNQVKRAPAPHNVASNVKDQIIRSRKGWLKRKAAEASTSNAGAATSAQAQGSLTQTSQNPAARGTSKH